MTIYRSNLNQLERVWEFLFHRWRLPQPYVPIRKFLYDQALFRRESCSVPVISIGGIEVGGVGKTPFILWLLSQLPDSKVAILHSGYGGGDEARLLGSKYPHAFVWSDKRRHLGLRAAENWGAELILLDDGFQCHRLARNLDIVVIDATSDERQQNLVPFGRLRESHQALKRADLIIANHTPCANDKRVIAAQIKCYSSAPILFMRPKLSLVPRVTSAVFCGLGKSKHFLTGLHQQGVVLKAQLVLSDHETPSLQLWRSFIQECQAQQVQQILCTEKDYHRFDLDSLSIPIVPIAIRLDVL